MVSLNKKDKRTQSKPFFQKIRSQTFKNYLDKGIIDPSGHYKFKPCDVLKTLDGKKAVEIAIDNEDIEILDEIVEVEVFCHDQSREGIKCFRRVVKTDEKSAKVVEMMDLRYPQSFAAKHVMPLFLIMPLLLRLVGIIYDETSDIALAHSYNQKDTLIVHGTGHNQSSHMCFSESRVISEKSGRVSINKTFGLEERLTPEDYRCAKYYTLVSLIVMLVLNGPMTYKKIMKRKKIKSCQYKEVMRVPIMLISPIFSPIMIVLAVGEMMLLKMAIAKERKIDKKAEMQQRFWDLQLQFGMYETVEAAEASAQLLLQAWLLGANYDFFYREGFLKFFKKAVMGALFVFDPETAIEDKTLGKFLVALISIIVGALSMYRRTKREAVHVMSSALLMISIFSQIVVHIACLAPLYFVDRHWMSLVMPIAIHYCLLGIIKVLFDPSPYLAKDSNKTIMLLNILGSMFINVNTVPTGGFVGRKTQKHKMLTGAADGVSILNESKSVINGGSNEDSFVTQHNPSTFFVQTLYFCIKFIENLTILHLVMYYCKLSNDTTFSTFYWKLRLTLYLGSLITWLSHIAHYRLHGHPWKFANGPTVYYSYKKKKKTMKWELYVFGKRIKIDYNNDHYQQKDEDMMQIPIHTYLKIRKDITLI